MKENTASSQVISEWKGQDILLFQEDLRKQVKGSISEKSFYSYFKNDKKKLPRIDILNMLSEYCGYQNWIHFKTLHAENKTEGKKRFRLKWIFLLLIGLMVIACGYFFIPRTHRFRFCFIDEDRNQPITKNQIDIVVLNDKQSPFYAKSDSLGCFQWKTKDDYIHFVIKSPYHKTDTIIRSVSSLNKEQIKVSTDDYALMLHYYANGKLEDWQNRKNELTRMIADDAIIFQVLPSGLGIEIYPKNKFIEKLTTPVTSLKNIEIIESKRSQGQIVKLKFRVKP